MKTSGWLVALAVATALAMQGCAGGGALKYAPGAAPSASHVSSAPAPAVTGVHDKSSFEAVQAAIEQQMRPGGRFAFVNNAGRSTVDIHLNDMKALFDQYGSVNKMDPDATTRLLADQNAVNEVLARYDSNRRVCWQETPVGTHFPKTVCRTLGQIQNQRSNSKQSLEQMRQLQQQQSSPASSGGH